MKANSGWANSSRLNDVLPRIHDVFALLVDCAYVSGDRNNGETAKKPAMLRRIED
jgi:hypothetical protein